MSEILISMDQLAGVIPFSQWIENEELRTSLPLPPSNHCHLLAVNRKALISKLINNARAWELSCPMFSNSCSAVQGAWVGREGHGHRAGKGKKEEVPGLLHLSEKNSLRLSWLLMLEIEWSPHMHRCIPCSNRCQRTWTLTFEYVSLACFLLHSFACHVLGRSCCCLFLLAYKERSGF